MLRKKLFVLTIFIGTLLFSCSKLHETFRGDLTQGQVAGDTTNTGALLQGVYNALENTFTNHLNVFPLLELTTDEAIAPTRGSNWDDNGAWRVFHQQKWNSSNVHIRDCFDGLNGIVYAATDMLRYHPNQVEQAQAKFLRAWAMYLVLDMFNQVPYRDPGESVIQPARVRVGTEALDYIISEMDAIKTD